MELQVIHRMIDPVLLRRIIPAAVLMSAAAFAPLSQAALPAAQPNTQVDRLLADAESAEKAGNLNLAIIQLKNATLLQPENGEIRARLGIALLRTGQAVNAERELRQAQKDYGPPNLVVPALLSAMLQRKEGKELLQEFPEPPQGVDDRTAPDVLIGRATALQLMGQPKDARTDMDRALSLRGDAVGLIASAKLARQQGDAALATKQADDAIKLSPDNEAAWTLKISLTGRSGDLKQALADAEEFLRRRPNSQAAKMNRIEVLLAQKNNEQAKLAVDEVLKSEPNSLYGRYFRAILLSRAKDYAGAWRVSQTLPGPFVQSTPSIARMVAAIAQQSGNGESSGAILAELLARVPDDKGARLQLATLRLSQKSPQEALTVLEPVKDDPSAQAVIAQAYLSLGQFDDAISSLEAAKTAPQANPAVTRELALLEMRAGDSDRAIDDLRDAVQRNPDNLALSGSLIGALGIAGKLDEALATAGRLIQRAPDSPLPLFYRGQVRIARSDLPGAISDFTAALAHDPNFAPALYYRGSALTAEGEFDAAKKDFRSIVSKNAASWTVWQRLIRIAIQTGQPNEAQSLFGQAISAAPKNPLPRLALATYLVSRGQFAEAQNAVAQLLQIAPGNPDAIALKGAVELRRGQTADAVKTFRALTSGPNASPAAYDHLAGALYAAKDMAAAEQAAKKAADLAPVSIDAQRELVDLQVAEGKGEAALGTARSYAAAHPGPPADLLVAYTLTRLTRVEEAEALLEKSIAAKPNRDVAMRLGELATESGDLKRAKIILDEWVKKNPNDAELRSRQAEVLMVSGDAGARQAYEYVLKLRPDDPIALNNLATLVQKDDPARAVALAARASKIAPNSAEIADTLGWGEYQDGNQQGALPALQHAHELAAANPVISFHYAVALRASGKAAEAKSLLASVLARNPKFDGSEQARQTLARW